MTRISITPIMSSFARIYRLCSIYRRAIHYRVPFVRRATFVPPKHLHIKGQRVPLAFDETQEGAKWDFISVILEDVYRLRDVKQTVKTVVDIGGNFGFFSVAARDFFPHASIHCYEPNTGIHACLSKNADVVGFQFFPEAVGGHNGKVVMDFDAGRDANLARVSDSPNGEITKITLEEVVKRIGGSVDLLKLDCEGAEWEMLEESNAWNQIASISMEYHLFSGQKHDDIRNSLKRHGYKIMHLEYDENCHYGHLVATKM